MEYFDRLESTNNYLLGKIRAGEKMKSGSAVRAGVQEGGKGRLGRSFLSREGGIYLSVYLSDLPLEKIHAVTPAAAVAVRKAIFETTGISLGIKWVNDLYLDGKKICGILTEGAGKGGAVIGCGINFQVPDFPPELSKKAGRLFAPGELPEGVSLSRTAEAVATALAGIPGMIETGDWLRDFKAFSVVLGKNVKITDRGGLELAAGRAVNFTEDGELVLRLSNGKEKTISAGEVSLEADGILR